MSEHFFNTEDGIIDPIPCLSDLTLYQDVSQESVKKEIRKSEEISDFDIQSLKVPDIRQSAFALFRLCLALSILTCFTSPLIDFPPTEVIRRIRHQ